MKTINISVPWRRRLLLGLIGILLAWAMFLGLRPQTIEVDMAAAGRAALRVTLEQEGRTRVLDRYVVAAPVNAYARRIPFEVGHAVERDSVLVELEPLRAEVLDTRRHAEAQARAAAAAANLSASGQRAKAAASNALLAQTELLRVRALRVQGHVSMAAEDRADSEALRSNAELRSAQFAVTSAGHELEAARSLLRYAASASSHELVRLRSPLKASILKIVHKSEGTVSSGQPLLEIGDPTALEVEVDLLSADAVRIHPGTRVLFERWGGEGKLEGMVRVIEPAGFTKISALGVEEQRVWVIITFTSPRALWQRLGDAYRVEASFLLWEGTDILQIPASALFRDGSQWAVFKVEQGKAVKRSVRVGQNNGLSAQILDGIKAGDQVIVHPDDRVREGIRVMQR